MAPSSRRRFLIATLSLLFLPLAYSDDLADAVQPGPELAGAWVVLVIVDIVLLGAVTALAWLAGRAADAAVTLRVKAVYATGALLMVALDVLDALTQPYVDHRVTVPRHLAVGLAFSLAFVLVLLAMSAALVVMTGDSWPTAVRSLLPLAVGTFAAYAGALAWESFTQQVKGEIDKEYFAQVSQIIPLLLIAIAFEANYLKELARNIAGRAIITVTVAMLCLGEAMALSVLPVPEGPSPSDRVALGLLGEQAPAAEPGELAAWHGYLAFILSLQASSIALVLLFNALIRILDQGKAAGGAGTRLGRVPRPRSMTAWYPRPGRSSPAPKRSSPAPKRSSLRRATPGGDPGADGRQAR